MRRVAGALGATLIAVLVAAVGQAAATATEVCQPTPKGPTSFCMSYDYGIMPAIATKPFAASLSFVDTSANVASDKTTWPDHATFDLLSTGVSPPVFTASKDLPDDLLIAGGGPCTSPAFTDCSGGHGIFLAEVSGTAGFFDGIYTGTFGVRSVVNVNVDNDSNFLHYLATFDFCLPFSGDPCFVRQSPSVPVTVPTRSGTAALSLPLRQTFDYTFSPFTAHVDGAATSLQGLTFHGTSNQLGSGSPADKTYTAFRLADSCGTAAASGAFTSIDNRVVTVPASIPIIGCTKTSVRVVAGAKIKPRGKVKSTVTGDVPVASGKLAVDLLKKGKHGFKPLATTHPSIDAHGKYKAAFKKPHAKSCKVVSSYGGDSAHAPSKTSKTFKCR